MLRKKSLFTAALCSVGILLASAGTAAAGEITGNGKPTSAPEHANSICAFSGQNDDPTGTQGHGPGGRTQSFGQDVRMGLDPRMFNPGDACRGNLP
jgi:hypothetical protein